MNPPVLTIIAGSNGCGKTSLSMSARNDLQQSPILDPDAIARSITDSQAPQRASNIDAGKQVLRLADELMEARQSFTVETTLSGSTYIRMATQAKRKGYLIAALFVGTSSVEINIERVKARVRKGGHDIPEEDQRRRYPRTLANMEKLLPLSDLVVMLDNSTSQGYVLVGAGHRERILWNDPVPDWAEALRNL